MWDYQYSDDGLRVCNQNLPYAKVANGPVFWTQAEFEAVKDRLPVTARISFPRAALEQERREQEQEQRDREEQRAQTPPTRTLPDGVYPVCGTHLTVGHNAVSDEYGNYLFPSAGVSTIEQLEALYRGFLENCE